MPTSCVCPHASSASWAGCSSSPTEHTIWECRCWDVVTGLGVGGLAVALAIRPTLENLIGGLMLFTDRPVRVGDFCTFGSLHGHRREHRSPLNTDPSARSNGDLRAQRDISPTWRSSTGPGATRC